MFGRARDYLARCRTAILLSPALGACSAWKPPDIAYDDTPQ